MEIGNLEDAVPVFYAGQYLDAKVDGNNIVKISKALEDFVDSHVKEKCEYIVNLRGVKADNLFLQATLITQMTPDKSKGKTMYVCGLDNDSMKGSEFPVVKIAFDRRILR